MFNKNNEDAALAALQAQRRAQQASAIKRMIEKQQKAVIDNLVRSYINQGETYA